MRSLYIPPIALYDSPVSFSSIHSAKNIMSDTDPEKITIVEGPPPLFDRTIEPWVYSLAEGPALKRAARCILRTFDGRALVERCTNAWDQSREVFLDYKQNDGLRKQALILAARCEELPEGHVLQLWLRLDSAFDDEADDLGIEPDDDNSFS